MKISLCIIMCSRININCGAMIPPKRNYLLFDNILAVHREHTPDAAASALHAGTWATRIKEDKAYVTTPASPLWVMAKAPHELSA